MLGEEGADVSQLRLTPGKLITIEQAASNSVLNRAIKAGMHVDIGLSDALVCADGITDAQIEQYFINAKKAIFATGAKVWGVHLPYKNANIAYTSDSAIRAAAVVTQQKMVRFAMQYLRPQHLVIHPSSGDGYLVGNANFDPAKANSQASLKSIQETLDDENLKYGTNSILCVENCPKSVAYDAESMLSLLSAKGLEKVRVCLDTGHALVPQNGVYRSPASNGDAVAMLKALGTKIGTLHIQQNTGVGSGTLDKHLQPFNGGLIDWGEFYYELLSTCRYRGCFLYETSYIDSYEGATSSLETTAANYAELICPAYELYLEL